jgi:23S rRNA pseudouridine1911/1915/1917 synthase
MREPSQPRPVTSGERQYRVESRCELLPWLTTAPLGLSHKRAKDLLRFRAIHVRNKGRVRHDTQLEAGDVVTIALHKTPSVPTLNKPGAKDFGLKILHLDEAIVVVDKPSGLLSMGSEREKEKTVHRILNEYLKILTKSREQQAFIVHRLDRETSGLMVLAGRVSAQAVLQENWKQVTKKYFVVVEGVPSEAEGTLTDHLAEGKSLMVRRVAKGGDIAITHYRLIDKSREMALLEITLETGRKHQIRVQLAGLGHPVAGDRKYGARTDPGRLALHSCELKFTHPVSSAPMEFRSPLPSRLRRLIARS